MANRQNAALLYLAAALGVAGYASVEDPVLYSEDLRSASTIQDRDPAYTPTYLVYADRQRTGDEAKKLVQDLGMAEHLKQYKARVFVIGPANGTSYDAAADLTAFQNLLRTKRSSNLKIIGVGAGATFVNNVLAEHAFAVAGILTYGGDVDAGRASKMPVPAYVHAAKAAVGKLYIEANGATAQKGSAAYTTYTNPSQGLQQVVVSKLSDAKESPAQAFANAWTTVFSRNYRLYMRLAEAYSQGFDPNNYTEPWELEPYVMYDELGMSYQAVTEDLPGFGLSLRYEYVPKQALSAAPKSVPLVILLHGNNNDPRIQGESGGWPEVAAKSNIILSSIEWQGRKSQEGTAFAAIGEGGTMAILDRLLAKFPQMDPDGLFHRPLRRRDARSSRLPGE